MIILLKVFEYFFVDLWLQLYFPDLDPLSDDAHFLIFRDDSIVQSLQNDRLDIDNLNLDPSILIGDVIYGANDEDNHLLDNPNPVPQLNVSEVINIYIIFYYLSSEKSWTIST